jgi:hypothetical protein
MKILTWHRWNQQSIPFRQPSMRKAKGAVVLNIGGVIEPQAGR